MKDQERVPLRVVLRNFLNHIENLESQSCPEKSYEAEFQDLKIFSENVKSLKEYSCLEGEKEVNRKKNRYKDILPFDVSRVVLNEYAGIPGSDYINANFIKGASGSPAYIASQGPLPSTVNDFWRMVVQCEVQVIVMACNEEEAGKAKCEKYWVDDGEEKQFGMISVKLLKSSTVCPDFSVRTMRLKYSNSQSVMEERTVCQLHYVAWPDHGVPTVVQPLLDMVRLVRDTQASETLPVLVHCSAGCGRTGTICAIDYVWGLLRTGKLTSDFSLLGLIREMRKQRIAMVQTKEQYVLVHQAVRELFKEQLCMIDSHPYENVDPNGLLIIKEEENTYDCIEYKSNNCSDEKNDNKEKEMIPPPLPSKRNVSKFPSKYEKEVENLSAQQRSMNYMSNMRSFLPLSHLNDKKKSNTEYDNNFEKINKNTSENISKPDTNKPIPSKGILRVPQLEAVTPKCSASIKRSKSLKVVGNCDKNTLSFCQNSPTESKRRSSLESNFDELALDSECKSPSRTRADIDPLLMEQKKKNVSQLISKYDIIKNQDHKTFIRSLTSLDMRQKLLYNNSNSTLSPFDDSVAKQKCKLLRSNTQINVLKRNNTSFCQTKNSPHPASTADSISNLKIETHGNFTPSKINHNATSLENLLDQNLKRRPKPVGSSTPSTPKHLNLMKSSSGKDLHLKNFESKTSPYQKLENTRQFKDISKLRGNSSKSEQASKLRYEDLYDCYSGEKGTQLSSKQDKLNVYGMKTLQSSIKKDSAESMSSSFDSSKFVRPSQLKLLRSQKKPQLNKSPPVHQQKPNSSLSLQSSSKGTYNSCRPYQEDLVRNRTSTGIEEFQANSSHVNEDYSTFPDHKPNPLFNSDHFMVDESNDIEPSLWIEKDSSRPQATFSKPSYTTGYVLSRTRGQTVINKPEDCKDLSRRLESDVDSCRNRSVPVMVDHYEEMNCDHDLNPYDASYSKECIPNEIKYILQNRRNVRQYNSSVHTTRHKNIPAPNICTEVSNPHLSRPSKTSAVLQRSIDAPSFSQDSGYFSSVSEVQRNYRDSDCFHSAPGVDLDQVAASITKNDENLMKVTLEELQVRKTKLKMAPKERCTTFKGMPNSMNSGDKKKQQQYL